MNTDVPIHLRRVPRRSEQPAKLTRDRTALLGAIFLSLFAGCGEAPKHASEAYEPIETATPTQSRFILAGDYLLAPLNIEEDWIYADTSLYLWIPRQEGSTFEAFVKHLNGDLIVGEQPIPQDSFLPMDGTLYRSSGQINLFAQEAGYTLEFDGNLSIDGTRIEGYFYFEEDYRLFASFFAVPGY